MRTSDCMTAVQEAAVMHRPRLDAIGMEFMSGPARTSRKADDRHCYVQSSHYQTSMSDFLRTFLLNFRIFVDNRIDLFGKTL